MKFLGISLLFLCSFQVSALTCTADENPTVNLSDEGGSLANLRVTDQNGLGICHIEQLHKMLQAKLPNHPDLSRVQLAIMEKKVRDQNLTKKNAVRWMKNPDMAGGVYIDAGNSCEAMNRLSNQSICLAQFDRFEELTRNTPADQMKIISSLSRYFDDRQRAVTEPMIEQIKNYPLEADEAIRSCTVSEEVFEQLIAKYVAFKKLKDPDYQLSEKFTKESLALSSQQIIVGFDYDTHISTLLPGIEEYDSGSLKTQLAHYLTKTEPCVLEKLRKLEPICSNFKNSEKDVLKLTEFGMHLGEIVNVLKGDLDRDKFFENAFNCLGDKKVTIPAIRCITDNLAPLAKKATNEADYQAIVDAKIEKQLALGTPVGISVCTRFFKQPKAKSFLLGLGVSTCGDPSVAGYKNGEGAHAVTIIGSRCNNGEKQYLVQNSWGDGCFYSKEFECTKKGGFWASSTSVISNTRNLNYLE